MKKNPSELKLECNECANKMFGLQGSVKVMAIPNKKAKSMCSPASAFEKEQMMNEELRSPS